MCRHRQPTDVYSDNGTNFTASHMALEVEFEKRLAKSSQATIMDRLQKQYGILTLLASAIWEAFGRGLFDQLNRY